METAQFTRKVENFTCVVCGTEVKGNGYTNHCPECLSSLHVDINPGDRASECHGVMLAERLEHKNGHDYIVHKCVNVVMCVAIKPALMIILKRCSPYPIRPWIFI